MSAKKLQTTTAPYEIVRKMRASIIVLGPILARTGKASVSLPGGCAIGQRPIDLHLKVFEQMGAKILLEDGYVQASAPDGLQGAEIEFAKVSVGATENALLAATLAKGTTILKNAACEPEVTDLAKCLIKMGAKIEGLGSSTLTIEGVKKLHGAKHHIIADRIEAGTFAVAAAMTGGELELHGINADIMQSIIEVLEEAGVKVEIGDNTIKVSHKDGKIESAVIDTEPYPGFPTDMQAQMCALFSLADGVTNIAENIFENRFMHIPELVRMGANIMADGNTATITGVDGLKGAEVMATDLRASVSLVLAALAANGTTIINRVYHIDRGYERIEEKLAACGAQIERVKGA
jgi:UDP-N-acetylglucosamine 1-carboxyvinyltransferase